MKRALNLAYAMQKWLWKLFQPRTRGVKVMLFNPAGHVLLIRNSYGRSDLFVLPGGGARPWETTEKAARREVREELGCMVDLVDHVSTHFSSAEGKRDTIHLFAAWTRDDFTPDYVEVDEARYFALDALPHNISSATLRRIEEHQGKRKRNGKW